MNDSEKIAEAYREIKAAEEALESARKRLEELRHPRLTLTTAQIAALMKERSLVRVYADGTATNKIMASDADREYSFDESGRFELPNACTCWLALPHKTLSMADIKDMVSDKPVRRYTSSQLNKKLMALSQYVRVWNSKPGSSRVYEGRMDEGYVLLLRPDGTFVQEDGPDGGESTGDTMTVYRAVDDKPRLAEMSYRDLVEALEG